MYNSKKNVVLSVLWLVLGAALMGLSAAGILEDSVYFGMGGALMAVGALQLCKRVRYQKDPEFREKVDTQNNDERNRFLRMKSWSWTGYIVVMTQAIGSVIALVLGKHTIQMILSYSVCLILTVYWITYVVLSKKY